MNSETKSIPTTVNIKEQSVLWRIFHVLFGFFVAEPLSIFFTFCQFPILASCIVKAGNAAAVPIPLGLGQLTTIITIVYILSIPLRIHVVNCALPIYLSNQRLEGKEDEVHTKYGLISNIIGSNLIALVFCGILWLLIPYVVKFAVWAGN